MRCKEFKIHNKQVFVYAHKVYKTYAVELLISDIYINEKTYENLPFRTDNKCEYFKRYVNSKSYTITDKKFSELTEQFITNYMQENGLI